MDNLVLACQRCNNLKGVLPYADFVALVAAAKANGTLDNLRPANHPVPGYAPSPGPEWTKTVIMGETYWWRRPTDA